ncbi:MAG: type II CAAX prenyl endopeptidase Rce1 family protein [Balneolaceae bacterium]
MNWPSYFRQTNTLLYSYILAVPLFVLYELLIRISQPGQEAMVRISVDIWFQSILYALGFNALSVMFWGVIIGGAILLFVKRKQLHQVKIRYLLGVLGESMVYALLILAVVGSLTGWIFQLSAEGGLESLSKLQLFALSLGAGLYEELFFRVILVSFLMWFLHFFTTRKTALILSVLIAALLFSAVHHIGEFGDPFTLRVFFFRFLFGLALNLVYVKRGFGCAAWTHALYDVWIVLQY